VIFLNSKLDDVVSFLKTHSSKLDENAVANLLQNLKKDLEQCLVPDVEVLKILSSKKNFKTITALKDLCKTLFSSEPRFKGRKDVEKEIAIKFLLTNRNISVLEPYVVKASAKKPKKTKTKKTKPKKRKAKKPKIADQTSRWLSMDVEDIKKELQDSSRYPTATALKQAGASLLSTAEKKKRKLEFIIKILIDKIENEKALLEFGA